MWDGWAQPRVQVQQMGTYRINMEGFLEEAKLKERSDKLKLRGVAFESLEGEG